MNFTFVSHTQTTALIMNSKGRFGCLRFVFGVTALLPLITSVVAVLVKEQPVRGINRPSANYDFLRSSKQHVVELWGAVSQRNVLLPTLFIFLWQATPQSDSAMFFFTYGHCLSKFYLLLQILIHFKDSMFSASNLYLNNQWFNRFSEQINLDSHLNF